jgi:putative glutamine amidotransferase
MNEELRLAFVSQNYRVVKQLLEQGANLETLYSDGHSVLDYAIYAGPKYVLLLIDHGVDVTNSHILHRANLYSQPDFLSELIQKVPALKDELLKEDGPIQFAIRCQDGAALKSLIKWVDNPADTFGYTPLHIAIISQDGTHFDSSLEWIDQPDNFGNTPLHWAVLNNDPIMTARLLQAGADRSIQTSKGQTAFKIANERNLVEVLKAFQTKSLINQAEFDELVNEYYWTRGKSGESFLEILKDSGFDPILKNINIKSYVALNWLGQLDTKGVDFVNCVFNGVAKDFEFQGRIENSEFNGFECKSCQFLPGTIMTGTTVANSIFSETTFERVVFSGNHFFYNNFSKDGFDHVIVLNNHFYANTFWKTEIHDSTLSGNDFFEIDWRMGASTTELGLEAPAFPVIGLFGGVGEIANFSKPGFLAAEPYLRIKENGAIPLLISGPSYLDYGTSYHLNSDVHNILKSIDPNVLPESIAQYILKVDVPSIHVVNAYAKEYAARLDGLWIPGGPDVFPGFYGKVDLEDDPYFFASDDLFELAMINEMLALGKPILGICHGAQLLNVYFGGTLLQDVPGHNGVIQPVEVIDSTGRLGSAIVGDTVVGFSAHHQAIDKLAEPLEIVAQYDGVIKAAQGKELPVWLSQFHPEYLFDDNNQRMLTSFFDAVKNNRNIQDTAINLADVLEMQTNTRSQSELLSEGTVMCPASHHYDLLHPIVEEAFP